MPSQCDVHSCSVCPLFQYLHALGGVRPQLCADNLKSVASDPVLLRRAARFTAGYVLLVGQEPAPSKCVLLSTSMVVTKEMCFWFLSDGEKWTVKFDVLDLGGHIDTSLRSWATTLSARVCVAAKDVKAVAVLPGGFGAKLGIVRSKFMASALHGCEVSTVAQGSFLKFAVSSKRMLALC